MRKILIVDDSAVVRDRLKRLLARREGGEVLAEAGEAKHGRESAGRLKPDVILDVQAYPEIRQRRLTAGADYFFDKSADYQDLVLVFSDIQHGTSAH